MVSGCASVATEGGQIANRRLVAMTWPLDALTYGCRSAGSSTLSKISSHPGCHCSHDNVQAARSLVDALLAHTGISLRARSASDCSMWSDDAAAIHHTTV